MHDVAHWLSIVDWIIKMDFLFGGLLGLVVGVLLKDKLVALWEKVKSGVGEK
jgi:hypothetical protein